jgi:sterol desaturase/sphingolipid hydroxylase (fatty acid hydroxylase superfamily)
MTPLASSLIYVALGVVLAVCAAARLERFKVLLAVLVLAPVVIPAFIDRVPRNLAQSGIYVVLLGVELVFAHRRYAFTSSENLRNAALVAFKRCAFIALKIFIFTAIAQWDSPVWGLDVNNAPFWAQALVALLAIDLYQYLCHRAQHRFEPWWNLHKLHHAPTELTVLVTSRSHVLDTMLRQVFGPGLLVYALGLSADAVLYGYVFPSVFLDALAHANIDFPGRRFRWLTYVVNTPNVHALHHTPTDDRVNYGMALAIWDRLFGTFKLPEQRPTQFGLADPSYARLGLLAQHLESLGFPMLRKPEQPTALEHEERRDPSKHGHVDEQERGPAEALRLAAHDGQRAHALHREREEHHQ